MATQAKSIVLGPGEGKKVSITPNEMTYKAVSEETGGAYALIEYKVAPEFAGNPRNIQHDRETALYVLEGELTFLVGDQTVKAPAGAFIQVPRGSVFAFSNPGSKPARFLALYSPGGFEKYFEELPEVIEKHGYPPPPDVMNSLVGKYGVEVVGPPLGQAGR
jgi:mannose-6-phosphate isomerase-like protein (cupin superfamily)